MSKKFYLKVKNVDWKSIVSCSEKSKKWTAFYNKGAKLLFNASEKSEIASSGYTTQLLPMILQKRALLEGKYEMI